MRSEALAMKLIRIYYPILPRSVLVKINIFYAATLQNSGFNPNSDML